MDAVVRLSCLPFHGQEVLLRLPKTETEDTSLIQNVANTRPAT
jgi:hypothetical protein